jgi:translation initiation factor IF-2
MDDKKGTRLSKLAKEFNVGISTIVEFLHKKGIHLDPNPNTKVPPEVHDILMAEYSSEIKAKKESEKLNLRILHENHESVSIADIETKREQELEEEEEEVLIKDLRTSLKTIEHPEPEEPVIEKKKTVAKKEKKVAEPKKKETAKEGAPAEELLRKHPEVELDLKVVGKIDLSTFEKKKAEKEAKKAGPESAKTKKTGRKKAVPKDELEEIIEPEIAEKEKEEEQEIFRSTIEKLSGPTVVGKIDLPVEEPRKKPVASSSDLDTIKKKRKRIHKDKGLVEFGKAREGTEKVGKKVARKRKLLKPEVNEEDVQRQIKDTLARLTGKGGKSKGSKYRREKREAVHQKQLAEDERREAEKNIIKVTEFVSVNELASMMNIPVNELISTCMNLGLFVSINQRLDGETMAILAEEFGYKVEFISVEVQEAIAEEEDSPDKLESRPPIVTVMGHVDHGKTKLLDYIRNTNVIAGEAGGITQHIGAYSVALENGRRITFLDTPGHEAFTAMRARGAQVTDVAIIVIAADDGVMPQTVEAINHAQAANVPLVFAINKIDKPTANSDKIREELSKMNLLVEEWGGKYQSQEISAKSGLNVFALLEKVLLEAEMLDLKANPNKHASGTIIESTLDKGRGYIATILVQSGTLRMGDVVLAGTAFGHVKAMYNERGKKLDEADPATPVLILGLNGAPQAGDKFNVMGSDREAKDIATKREQLQREQELRTKKHITLDEIGRRIAIGNFKELNVIVKGDVDGSVEALSDSLIKLSTEQIQVNVIHKAVGQISESDIMLAIASNAIVIGFQVRPSLQARKLAEKEQIDIRLYSIIYNAINELRDAMEGMLAPEIKEEIVATLEVKEVFKITKTGTVAGCFVREGKINRTTKVRVIRDGIVVYSGELASLKRFKDDVKEVVSGLECGLNIVNYNDIKVGDVIEGYTETEIRRTL